MMSMVVRVVRSDEGGSEGGEECGSDGGEE